MFGIYSMYSLCTDAHTRTVRAPGEIPEYQSLPFFGKIIATRKRRGNLKQEKKCTKGHIKGQKVFKRGNKDQTMFGECTRRPQSTVGG